MILISKGFPIFLDALEALNLQFGWSELLKVALCVAGRNSIT